MAAAASTISEVERTMLSDGSSRSAEGGADNVDEVMTADLDKREVRVIKGAPRVCGCPVLLYSLLNSMFKSWQRKCGYMVRMSICSQSSGSVRTMARKALQR